MLKLWGDDGQPAACAQAPFLRLFARAWGGPLNYCGITATLQPCVFVRLSPLKTCRNAAVVVIPWHGTTCRLDLCLLA